VSRSIVQNDGSPSGVRDAGFLLQKIYCGPDFSSVLASVVEGWIASHIARRSSHRIGTSTHHTLAKGIEFFLNIQWSRHAERACATR
jgi:hypothetical protein